MVGVGVFGLAFTISGLFSPLPPPTGGGTCGPGQGSEAAVVAIFDPVTIGAGPRPPADQPGNLARWSAFVHGCQTSSDQRAAVTLPLLVASAGLAVLGGSLVWRRSRASTDGRHEDGSVPWPPLPPNGATVELTLGDPRLL
jgi:hypothetical protein